MISADDRRHGLRPPRFALGTLMAAVALCGVFFAVLSYAGSHVTALLVLFALAVLAHVAGNAIGTRLRECGDARLGEEGAAETGSEQSRQAARSAFAPASRLRQRASLGPAILVITVVGTLLCGAGGGYGFFLLADRPVALANVVFGALAAAVLGGIWTFIAASFVKVAGSAIWQAARDANPKR
jgi:hypothetical protein